MRTQLRSSAGERRGPQNTAYVFIITGLATFLMGLAIWPLKIEYRVRSSLEYRTPEVINTMSATLDRGMYRAPPEALITDEILKKTVLAVDPRRPHGHLRSKNDMTSDSLRHVRRRLHVFATRGARAGDTSLFIEHRGPHLKSSVAFISKLLEHVVMNLQQLHSNQTLEQLRVAKEERRIEFDDYVRSQLREIQVDNAKSTHTTPIAEKNAPSISPLVRVVSATREENQKAREIITTGDAGETTSRDLEIDVDRYVQIGHLVDLHAPAWEQASAEGRFHELKMACAQADSRYQEALHSIQRGEFQPESKFPGIETSDSARMVGFVGHPMSKQHFWMLSFCSCVAGMVLARIHSRDCGQPVLGSAEDIQRTLGIPLVGLVPTVGVVGRPETKVRVSRCDPFVFASEVLLVFIFGSIVVMSAASRVFFSELIVNPFAAFSYLITSWLS